MREGLSQRLMLAAAFAGFLPVAACSVDVQEQDFGGGKKAVDIRSPVGNVSVRTGLESPDTGLALYPGARPLRDEHEPENADVSIGGPGFGLKVIATHYESEADPDAIVGHYRDAMKAYGDVVECRGEIDFRGRRGSERPVCRQRMFSRETQLVVGTEQRHRLVSIKPRGGGSEFAVVYIQTRS